MVRKVCVCKCMTNVMVCLEHSSLMAMEPPICPWDIGSSEMTNGGGVES